ncbi:GNAT family N-acetyltransferase [Alginatibacterium sediminis]|uniref:GNAT family N-acetyltransferase n=1 Tax=Alginatibacterium sediminis TaxID=2164068 RepID=A0A420ED38_9ALTE|nr:bifunctional acetate--CoA ligase family protein/GNAT family N-acetyltransferase [Alginatibacterium sediminis]RKF18586.1 GNAT family N-acetyltransferase [Alginatibacterium sediminis]
MRIRSLSDAMNPQSVAVIGASNRERSAGRAVMLNLLQSKFKGPVMPVSRKHKAVLGVLAYPSIESLPISPDLAILCVANGHLETCIQELIKRECKLAIIIADGQLMTNGVMVSQSILSLARANQMRILGPNSLGLILPYLGLNASSAHIAAHPGHIAFISQSAAIATTVLDWANTKQIGFSNFVSIGDALDTDASELMDFLGRDPRTQAVMIYIDSVQDPQRFMSAARAISRIKPVLVVKSGRSLAGAKAAVLHTGGRSGYDGVFDAAIRRSGMLRVGDLHELFAAVETLAHSQRLRGERLAIMSNGGGPAVLALDALIERGGKLAQLGAETIAKLNQCLPQNWSGTNPIDMLGDADPERYRNVLEILLQSDELDAVLIMYSPSALSMSHETAQAVIDCCRTRKGRAAKINILSNWMGEETVASSRKAFAQARLPTYRTPEGATGAFMHMVEYRRNQKFLTETPQSISSTQDLQSTLDKLDAWSAQQQFILETHQVAPILNDYKIEVVETKACATIEQAIEAAQWMGYPVALKIQSQDFWHKSDVHGVSLNLNSAEDMHRADQAMRDRVAQSSPDAKIEGLIVQRMALSAGAQELRIAVIDDDVFGPVIALGEGSDWDLSRDAAFALPPLNMALSRYLVIQALKTQKIRDRQLLQGLDMDALCRLLTRISKLVVDCPQILALDLNPVVAMGKQMLVLDANVRLRASTSTPARLAIQPYPKQYEQQCETRDGKPILLRPILPEDEPLLQRFDAQLSDDDRYKRYFGAREALNHEDLAVLTQIDYSREMAFVATRVMDSGEIEILAVARGSIDPDNIESEFAMAVRSDLQGLGLGKIMLVKLIDYYREQGTQQLAGMTMMENRAMAGLARKLGFAVSMDMEEGVIQMHMQLQV